LKFKLNGLLIIDILAVLLVIVIILVPSSTARIVLGLPFLLFFPGYTLVVALFPLNKKKENTKEDGGKAKRGIDGIERVALSFGMSIAVTALIGLGLNYTPWGIRQIPVITSIAVFIIIMSIIAFMRHNRLHEGSKAIQTYLIKMPGWSGNAFNKTLTVILAIAILGTIGTLGYTIAKPKIGERFTEFYILGNNGKAETYPTSFVMEQGAIVQVSYDKGATFIDGKHGILTLGIINQEQRETTYSVALQIDGQDVAISHNGTNFNRLEHIKLQQGEKREFEIGFTPQHTGDNQKVEFFLYKDSAATTQETLHLWIDVKGE
jgi:uncharacterized membrane protein